MVTFNSDVIWKYLICCCLVAIDWCLPCPV